MPVIPKLDKNPVQPQAMPGVRVQENAPIEQFGGGAASGVQAFGAINEVIQKEKEKADNTATQELYVELVKRKNDLMYDPKEGALNRKGKDTLAIGAEYDEKFNKIADEIEAKATNDTQREIFRKMRSKEGLELNTSLERHTFGEMEKHQDQTYQSMIATLKDDTIANMKDANGNIDYNKIQKNIDLAISSANTHAARKGYDGTQTKQLLTDIQSDTHSAVIKAMLADGQDLKAKEYFEKNQKTFNEKDSNAISKIVNEGSVRGESQRKADEILASGGDLKSAYAATKDIEDPKVREATEQRIKDHFTIKERADNQRRENTTRSVFQDLEKSGGQKMPSEGVWLSLDNDQRQAIEKRREQLISGRPVKTDQAKWYGLQQMAVDPATQQKFIDSDLNLMKPYLSDSDFQEIAKMQMSMRKGEKSDDLEGIRTKTQIMNDKLAAAGFDTTPKTKEKALQLDDARAAVDEEIRREQKEKGRVLTRKEVEEIADKNLTQVVLKGTGFLGFGAKKKSLYQVVPGEQVEINIDHVPPSAKAVIEEGLKRRNNRKPTDKEISEGYIQYLKQSRGR